MNRNAPPGLYPSQPVQAVIDRMLEFGETSVPYFFQLLESADPLVARIGAVALTKVNHLDERYLPQVLNALDRDIAWLPTVLTRIGTPEAAEAAVRQYLNSRSSPHNQEMFAVVAFGANALPAIMRAAQCGNDCDEQTHFLLGYALGEMREGQQEAAASLLKIAEDATQSAYVRHGALRMISFVGEPGLPIEQGLLELAEREPEFKGTVDHALIGIKSSHAGAILAEFLKSGADRLVLRDIAELGPNGVSAGMTVTSLLDSNDLSERVMAVRTLGYIGFTSAASKLIDLLNDPTSAQLNWVAAESLGRMQAKVAIPALRNAAESHWYPPVRDAANKALAHIESAAGYESKFHRKNFSFDYFQFQHMDMEPCESISLESLEEPQDRKLYAYNNPEALEQLAYDSVVLSYGARDEEQQMAEDPGGIIRVNPGNIIEHRTNITQVPDVALRLASGWLAGSDRGEWGGELVHIQDDGTATVVLNDNVEDIYQLGQRYIALSGLAHMTMNSGRVLELIEATDGTWTVHEWRGLPGAPRSSAFMETGELLINTASGGSLLLNESGDFRMANCEKPDKG
ncbi:MAG: hypothetical protein DHS20C11_07140 [Lysobacteraceae bacterium]|nr:MAG: hypothetical protein DHS20C11_07140 [Xanthomonadaceae bacterium]